MDIKYINHLNEELDLSGLPYLLQFSNAFDFSWEYETFGQTKRNCKIKNFKRQKKNVEAEIIIKAKDFEAALNRFAEITEKDLYRKLSPAIEIFFALILPQERHYKVRF